MDSSSEEEVIVTCLLAEDEEEQQRRRKRTRKMWIHGINQKRIEYGEFNHLFPDLIEDEVKFFRYFRMSQEMFFELLNVLRQHIVKQNTTYRRAIEPEQRLAICLRFLATGNSFRSLAFSYRMGESTVRTIVYSTCQAIWTALKPIVMPKPDEHLWMSSEKDFSVKWNFPNAVAAIDGKHVIIQAPPHSGSLYFCYKKQFSIVLLALVDANYKFLVIDVGGFGKNSDASIFHSSSLGTRGNTSLPHVIIGDEAFPLCTYLMRPYSRDDLCQNEEKRIFNYRLSRARNTVENAFGLLVRKFRIFERKLDISHEHCIDVVSAACCLHNFLRNDVQHWTDEDRQVSLENAQGLRNIERIGGQSRRDALEVRDVFKHYFNSAEGKVEWQERRVRSGRHLPQ